MDQDTEMGMAAYCHLRKLLGLPSVDYIPGAYTSPGAWQLWDWPNIRETLQAAILVVIREHNHNNAAWTYSEDPPAPTPEVNRRRFRLEV